VKLYSLTLPGLDVPSDWRAVHDRLLDDFVEIDDVLPTTIPGTVVIVYRGSALLDGWLQSIDEAVLGRCALGARHRGGGEQSRLRS
jgi:hypothetical protein